MRRYTPLSLIAVVLLVTVFFVGMAHAPVSGTGETSMFRYNAQHIGDHIPMARGSTPNGQLKCNYAIEGFLTSSATLNGIVYVGSWDHGVYALNATTGTKVWNYTTGGLVYSSPTVAYGIVYIGSVDYNVYALNATTGTKVWNYTTGGFVNSSPTVANRIGYIGSNDHNVYALGSRNIGLNAR